MSLVGRHAEQRILKKFYNSKQAEFLAIYGRRRIGKTFLIKQYFANTDGYFFHVTGIKDGSLQEQVRIFIKAISSTFYKGSELKSQDKTLDDLFK